MGESIVEGTLTKWLKKPGEHVERDEPLFEISTDKVDTEIPAPASGVLSEVLVEEGKTVAISTVVGRINETGGNGASAPAPVAVKQAPAPPPGTPAPPPRAAQPVAPPPPPAPRAPEPRPVAYAEPESTNGPLSPLVRKMAREYGIDLRQVKGTGMGGRITKQDLEAYMSAQGARTMAQVSAPVAPVSVQQAAPPPPPPQPQSQAVTPIYTSQQQAPAPVAPRVETARARIEPMSTMRSKIAEHMILSKRVSAHVTTVHKVDMTRVAKMRTRFKQEFERRYGFGLTYLPFVISAAVEAIHQFPIVNASIEGNNIIYHNDINVGIAVALENGLIVPVIRGADEKNIVGLQRSVVDLSTRARSRQLKPDEVQGGTFSITNFGSFGSVFATPIINQPQVAILGVGAVEKVPVVVDDAIAIRSVAYLALTFDHRLIDGATADQYTGKVKSILENWSEEVL
jgi:2-oxoglutarate dehydrogenase E2 component (dihydrolipoamide succinyltransferase)